VTRWQRPGAREILLLFVVLSAVAGILSLVSHTAAPAYILPVPVLLAIFCAWRVSRGGWLSRLVLLVLTAAQYVTALLVVAGDWNIAVASLVVIYLVQLLLLVSPPVVACVRGSAAPAGAKGWAAILAMARRPPGWLLAWGILLGVSVSLVYLTRVGLDPIPGCSPAAADTCYVFGQGYPVRWLTAGQAVSRVHVGSLVKDCVQWTLVSWSVLYAGWLWLRPAPRRQAAA
jgi:hypothetical protein